MGAAALGVARRPRRDSPGRGRCHRGAVGVPVAGMWLTRLLQAAGPGGEALKAGKTLTVGLEEEEEADRSTTAAPTGLEATLHPHRPGPGPGPHRSGSVVDAALGRSRAASVLALTRVDGHAHASVPAVAVVTGAGVLVWTRVDAGGVDVAHLLETRVDG